MAKDFKELSYDEQSALVCDAFQDAFPPPEMDNDGQMGDGCACSVIAVYPDYIVVQDMPGEYYRVGYTLMDDGTFEFDPQPWERVEREWATSQMAAEMKKGRTPGGSPSADMRKQHAVLSDGRFPVWDRRSALAALRLRGRGTTPEERKKIVRACRKYAPKEAEAAMEADKGGKSVDLDELVFFGGAVKALGGGKVGGYLVRYGNQKDTDADGEFFTADTDFDIEEGKRLGVYYHHGLDSKIGKRRIGRASVRQDDAGLWAEAQLELRNEYEKAIYQMVETGKLGWSSGAVSHLVERQTAGKATQITRWPIGEASLTPTPAEARNMALPIKSLLIGAGETDLSGPVKSETLKTGTADIESSETTACLQLRARAYITTMGD